MGKRFDIFKEELKKTIKGLGSATGSALKGLEESDKKMNESIKKATGGIE